MKHILKKIRSGKLFSEGVNKLKELGLKKTLPLIYVFILFFGIILTIAYAYIHSLVVCSSIFGTEFCTPTGIFIALTASLPGYIIAGNVLLFTKSLHWVLSLAIVIITSLVFYYFFGLLIDKIRLKNIHAEILTKVIVVVFFLLLLFLAVILYFNLS